LLNLNANSNPIISLAVSQPDTDVAFTLGVGINSSALHYTDLGTGGASSPLRKATNGVNLKNLAVLETEAHALGDLAMGFAENITGGSGLDVYWVSHTVQNGELRDTRQANAQDNSDFVYGSFRWAVQMCRENNGGIILFEPKGFHQLSITWQEEIPSNTTIWAPNKNVVFVKPTQATAIKPAGSNIIIRGIYFKDVKDLRSHSSRDGIYVDPNITNLMWIDSCTFEQIADGCIDINSLSEFTSRSDITISNCIFRGHDKTMLIGSLACYQDTEDGTVLPTYCATPLDAPALLHVTLYNNYFDHTSQRNAKVLGQTFVDFCNNFVGLAPFSRPDASVASVYGTHAHMGARVISRYNHYASYAGDGYLAVDGIADGVFSPRVGSDLADASPGAIVEEGNRYDSGITSTPNPLEAIVAPTYTTPLEIVPVNSLEEVLSSRVGGWNHFLPYNYVVQSEADSTGIYPDGVTLRGDLYDRTQFFSVFQPLDVIQPIGSRLSLELGTNVVANSVGQIGVGNDIDINIAAYHASAMGQEIYVGELGDMSFNAGRGIWNNVSQSVSVGSFPTINDEKEVHYWYEDMWEEGDPVLTYDKDAPDILNKGYVFQVGSGGSTGSRRNAIGVKKDSGTTEMQSIAYPRDGSKDIVDGIVRLEAVYHTLRTEGWDDPVTPVYEDDIETILYGRYRDVYVDEVYVETVYDDFMTDGLFVMITPASSAGVITIKHDTEDGNIRLAGEQDIILDGSKAHMLQLFYQASRGCWTNFIGTGTSTAQSGTTPLGDVDITSVSSSAELQSIIDDPNYHNNDYNDTLVKWAAQEPMNNLVADFGLTSHYDLNGYNAINDLQDNHNWSITDGGVDNNALSDTLTVNPNFDTDINNWNPYNGGNSSAVWDNGKIEVTSGSNGLGYEQGISLIAGRVYVLSAEVQATATGPSILGLVNSSRSAFIKTSENINVSDGVTNVSFIYENPTSTNYYLYLRVGSGSGRVGVYDNIYVKELQSLS